jgi:hypothetical protein
MEEFKTILVLENEIEAQLLDSILTERDIPHFIKTYHDSAYDGIYQSQKGWGRLESPEEYKQEIMEIYASLPVNADESPIDP